MMLPYEQIALNELKTWQQKMLHKPTIFSRLSKKMQTAINKKIPEKIHAAITSVIKQMIRGVLFGSTYTSSSLMLQASLKEREEAALKKIEFYRNTAAVEGGVTGAGGILLGLADFPILIGIKIKLLFEIAAVYGFDTDDYRERIYLLHIFELAFSSDEHRRNVYLKMVRWENRKHELPKDIHAFEWRPFQQEYRDYIDLAKMAQLIPFIGAPVGVWVNYRLLRKLGNTAMNAYRMRLLQP
jgi:hypothetical protein